MSFMNANTIFDAHTRTVVLHFAYVQCDLVCTPQGSSCPSAAI
jgi:hypothetical protein